MSSQKSDLAQPCLQCLETLGSWAGIFGLDEDQLKTYVEANPVEPYKGWTITGRGGVKLQCYAYRCPRCNNTCLLYTSPSPRDGLLSRMPSSA